MFSFRANDVTFVLDGGELSRDGRLVKLAPMAARVLEYLLERPGDLVTKSDLLQNVWQEESKSDDVISTAVHDLRLALGDDPAKPAFIKTVARRGYKFVAGVTSTNAREMAPPLQAAATAERPGTLWARIHGTKFDVPRRSEFWNSLPHEARRLFRLVGNSNKSWFVLDSAQATALGDAIIRICLSGGSVGILSGTDEERCVDATKSFLKRHVFKDRPGEPWLEKGARLNALTDHLDYSAIANIHYRAVVSDGRALIIPLLNTSVFNEQAMVIEVTETDHPVVFKTYLGDIDRLQEAAANYFPSRWTEALTDGRLHHIANTDTFLAELNRLGIVPRDLVVYVTSRCNLRCKHCYVGNRMLSEEHIWALRTIRSLIGTLELDRLTLVGGEPLEYSGLEEVLTAAATAAIGEKRLTTNLTELADGQIETIKRTGFRACVSLDGAVPGQHDAIRGAGQFKKTIANLQRLIKNDVDVEVTHTVTNANACGFRELVDLLRNIGVRRLNLHKVSPQGNGRENRHMVMTPTQWREFLRDILFTIPRDARGLAVRYPPLFATREEYEEWTKEADYHHHARGSYYSARGHRLVLYADGKVFVSSEAFGTESHVGQVIDGRFQVNETERNELVLSQNPDFRVSDLNEEIQGDDNYPLPLSFSYRRAILL